MRKRILYVQYSNPGAYPPVQHSARILADAGFEILILGVRTSGTEALRLPADVDLSVRLMPDCRPGILQKVHYLMFGCWTILTALYWRPDWIYLSDPLACPIGWVLSFVGRWKIIYHEHDIPFEVSVPRRLSIFMRFVLWARRRLTRVASFCVVPNETRAQHLKQQLDTAAPIFSVFNCPSLREANSVLPKTRAQNEMILFFHGSIVPDRLPRAVIHALRECPDKVRLEFAGYETRANQGYVNEILQMASELGLAERVNYLGALPTRTELLKRCAQADVGLSLMPLRNEDLNMVAMVGASNKPFDYLLCGLALLISDLSDWKRAFVEPGFGLSCSPEDPQSLAVALQWFVDHPQQRREMGETGRQRILLDWNYETQFSPVLAVIDPAHERCRATVAAV